VEGSSCKMSIYTYRLVKMKTQEKYVQTKVIIQLQDSEGKLYEGVREILKPAEIKGIKKMRIPPENKFEKENKQHERLRFQWKEGKPYLGVFLNGGAHTMFFALNQRDIGEMINFLMKTKKKIILYAGSTNNKEVKGHE